MEDLFHTGIIPEISFYSKGFRLFIILKLYKSILKLYTGCVVKENVHRVNTKREKEREKKMGLYVNTNINSLIAQRSINSATSKLQTAITRLSTGYRVNQAGDDAAGLCVAQGLDTQIRGNKRAMLNVEDGLNMMYIAEGGMDAATEDLQRIRELCIQAANGIYSQEQQQTLMNEIKERLADIDVIAETTTFNGLNLTNGSQSSVVLQSGSAGDLKNNTIDVSSALTDLSASALGVALNIIGLNGTGDTLGTDSYKYITETGDTYYKYDATTGKLDKTTEYTDGTYDPSDPPKVNAANWTGDHIRAYIDKLDAAINKISENRAQLGAYQNRLQSVSENLASMNENYERSKSQIMDADMAEESANMVKYQVLQQTSAAMLAQANQIPSIALQLLGQ